MNQRHGDLFVGQVVVVKTVAEMLADGEQPHTDGGIDNKGCYFNPLMKQYSGTKHVIEGFVRQLGYMQVVLSGDYHFWKFAPYMLKPVEPKYPSNYAKAKHANVI